MTALELHLKSIIKQLLNLPEGLAAQETLKLGIGTGTDRGKTYLAAMAAVESTPSQVDVTAQTTTGDILLESMVSHFKDKKLREAFSKHLGESPLVTAELLINGVQVPLQATLEQCWDQLSAYHDEHVLEAAQRLISAASLNPVLESLRAAEVDIAEALQAWTKSSKVSYDKQRA